MCIRNCALAALNKRAKIATHVVHRGPNQREFHQLAQPMLHRSTRVSLYSAVLSCDLGDVSCLMGFRLKNIIQKGRWGRKESEGEREREFGRDRQRGIETREWRENSLEHISYFAVSE